jgi:hypothetical protein
VYRQAGRLMYRQGRFVYRQAGKCLDGRQVYGEAGWRQDTHTVASRQAGVQTYRRCTDRQADVQVSWLVYRQVGRRHTDSHAGSTQVGWCKDRQGRCTDGQAGVQTGSKVLR